MMNRLLQVAALMLGLGAGHCMAQPSPSAEPSQGQKVHDALVRIAPYPGPIDPARGLLIKGPITSGTFRAVQQKIDALVADSSTDDITIALNSPGGEVVSGMQFVGSMRAAQAKGIRIKCYVTGMAASMAFMILTQCDERNVLDTSFLLWHGVRVQAGNQPITAKLAESLAADLALTDELIVDMLDETLHLSHDKIMKHFDAETFWSGVSLEKADPRFLDSKKAFPELNKVLSKFTTQGEQSLFDILFGGIILISDKVYRIYNDKEAGK